MPPTTAELDALHQQWLDERTLLQAQVVAAQHDRQIWGEMRAALVAADNPSILLAHYARLYSSTQAITVRRIADPYAQKSTASLGRLVRRIRANPDVVSRDRYETYASRGVPSDDLVWHRADRRSTYDAEFGDGPQIRKRVLDDWDTELKLIRSTVGRYANKAVAHIDTDLDPADVPTFHDLHDSLESLSEILISMTLLLDGSSLQSTTPVIQGDWKAPLRTALF